MRIFHSKVPFRLTSEFRGPRVLNFADDGKKAAGFQEDNLDEPDADSPAGKKWAKLREEKRAAEEAVKQEREARIKAEAKAEAFEEFKASLGTNAKKEAPPAEEDDTEVNPQDEAYVNKILTKQLAKAGLDKIPEVVNALRQSAERSQAETALERAKRDLETEFKDSVPFDFDAALSFAKEKGYGMIATTAREALRMAHKEMNEELFIDHYRGGSKKKVAPKMAYSGRNSAADDDITDERKDDVKIEDFNSARVLARQVVTGEQEEE